MIALFTLANTTDSLPMEYNYLDILNIHVSEWLDTWHIEIQLDDYVDLLDILEKEGRVIVTDIRNDNFYKNEFDTKAEILITVYNDYIE